MSSDPAIRITDLSKSYQITHNDSLRPTNLGEAITQRLRNPFKRTPKETFWALKGIDLEIKRGEVVGVIGCNGAGKSTLLKVLSRITEPTTGRIELFGRVGSLLEVGTGFHPELTGRENIFLNGAILGMKRSEIHRQFDEIIDFAGVEKFLDTPVKRYSSGMYVRLAFAVAAHLNPEILIIDEVLAVGDAEFQKKCLGKMQDVAQSGRTVLFVSHNMAAISSLCNTAIYLQDGQVASIGKVNNIVNEYAKINQESQFTRGNGPLKDVIIEETVGGIYIEVSFEVDHPLRLPCLGFLIKNLAGVPICAANPKGRVENLRNDVSNGVITVLIRSPILIPGIYLVSLWFGDGTTDFWKQEDAIRFESTGLSIGNNKYSQAGSVVAECDWTVCEDPLGDHDERTKQKQHR